VRKYVFGLKFSEVSVHCQPAPWLLDLDEAEISWWDKARWSTAAHFIVGSREKGVTGRSLGQDTPFKDTPLVTHFLQLGHIFQFLNLPIMYSNFESISGLIHCLGQILHNLITSGKQN
jgi:hypothetical protein